MKNKGILVFVLPSVLLILSPVLLLFVESLRGDSGGPSLEALRGLSLSSRQLGLMENSLLLASGAAFFSLVIGVPLAFLIQRTDLPLRSFFGVACLIPLLIPPYMQAIVWTKIYSYGRALPLGDLTEGAPFPAIRSIPGGILVFTLSFYPFVTLITSSGLKSIDRSLEEVSWMSRGLGRTISGVTLPLVTPHITSSAILVFVFTLVNFEAADILRIKVFPIEIFINFSAYYNERAATILSIPLISFALVLIWGQMLFMRGKLYVNFERDTRGVNQIILGRLGKLFTLYPLLMIGLSVIVPLFVLMEGAGDPGIYIKAFHDAREQILYTLSISALSASVMVVLSFAVAYYLERHGGLLASILEFVTQTPFAVPSIVLGIGLIKVWNRPGLDWIYDSSIILIIGYVAGYCPFTIKILSTKMKQIDRKLEEAAALCTDRWPRIVGHVLVPLALPGLVAGFLTGFVLSIANLGTALLVIPPGRETLPIKIYNFMHYGAEDMVFALSVLLIFMVLLFVTAVCVAWAILRPKMGT